MTVTFRMTAKNDIWYAKIIYIIDALAGRGGRAREMQGAMVGSADTDRGRGHTGAVAGKTQATEVSCESVIGYSGVL